MDNEVRELLRDIAADIPPLREVPPTLRPRARRRIVATVGMTVVLVAALVLGSVAALRAITQASPAPADLPTNVQLPNAPGAWQRIEIPYDSRCPADNCHMELVAAGDAGLVVTGWTFNGSVEWTVGWSSPDGLSWHPIAPTEVDGVAWGQTAAGPGFVAVGREGVWRSTDGLSWDLVHSLGGRNWFSSVAAGGPGMVAVGRPNKAWYSSDGLTWEAATVPPVPANVYPGDDGRTPQVYMKSVAAGADRLVATGEMTFNDMRNGPAIWVSSDGTSWRDVPIDGDVFPRGCSIYDVAGGPDGFVGVGRCDAGSSETLVWRSPDGVHWERVGRDAFDGEAPGRVAASPTGWVAVGGDALWTSVDGATWTRVPTGPTFRGAGAGDVTAWGSRFVVLGSTDDGQNVVWISGPQE